MRKGISPLLIKAASQRVAEIHKEAASPPTVSAAVARAAESGRNFLERAVRAGGGAIKTVGGVLGAVTAAGAAPQFAAHASKAKYEALSQYPRDQRGNP